MQDIIHSFWFGLACLAALGAVLTLLLCAAKIPGGTPAASIAAGIISGILLGATVLGNSNPDLYQHWFVGAVEERAALAEAEQQLERDIAAMREADVTEVAITEYYREHQIEINTLDKDYLDSLASHEVHLKFLSIISCVFLVYLSFRSSYTRSESKTSSYELVPLLFVVLTTGVPMTLILLLIGYSGTGAALAGMCVSIGAERFSIGRHLCILQANRTHMATTWLIFATTIVAIACAQIPLLELISTTKFWVVLLSVAIISHDGRWLAYCWIISRYGDRDQRETRWELSGNTLNSRSSLWQAMFACVFSIVEIIDHPVAVALILSALIIELCQPIRQPVARWMDERFSKPINPE